MSAKQAYEEKIQSEMDRWEAEFDKLIALSKSANADMRIEIDKQLDDLSKQRKEINNSLTELKDASDNAWEDVKNGLEQSYINFTSSLEKAMQRFS